MSTHSSDVRLALLVVATVAASLWIGQLGAPLRNDDAPRGGVSLQLAFTRAGAQRVIDSWRRPVDRIERARTLQWLDYGFIVLYGASLALLGRRVAHGRATWIARAGRLTTRAAVCAAGLDAVENVAMLLMLTRGPGEVSALVAGICSAGKFALLGIALVALAAGAAGRLTAKSSSSSAAVVN